MAGQHREPDRVDGFTLIEVMVVVLIIAVLVAIAIPTFLAFRSSAQDRGAQVELRTVLLAQRAHWLEHGVYTASADAVLVYAPAAVVDDADSTLGVESWTNAGDTGIVCLTRHTPSGNVFSVWESATDGTFYGATDLSGEGGCPATAPAEYSEQGW